VLWLEALGVVTGAVCVWLAVRLSVWTFPVGLVNNACFLAMYWIAGIHANALLQLVFAVLAVLGWTWWLRGDHGDGPLRVHRPSPRVLAGVLGATAVCAVALVALLGATTDSPTWVLDGVTTATSLGAQLMLGRKWIANWYLWIFTDVLTIVMNITVGLYLTAALYGLFLVMCLQGLRLWRRELHAQDPASSTARNPVAAPGGAA